MSNGIEIRGLDELIRKANKNRLLGRPLKRFFTASAIDVQRNAKKRAPVDTGRLRDSIVYEVQGGAVPMQATIGTNVKYAPFVEFGTRPHFPPPSALETWARRHGLPNGFVVAQAIAIHGTKEHRYLRGGLEDSVSGIKRHLNTAADEMEAIWGG